MREDNLETEAVKIKAWHCHTMAGAHAAVAGMQQEQEEDWVQ